MVIDMEKYRTDFLQNCLFSVQNSARSCQHQINGRTFLLKIPRYVQFTVHTCLFLISFKLLRTKKSGILVSLDVVDIALL